MSNSIYTDDDKASWLAYYESDQCDSVKQAAEHFGVSYPTMNAALRASGATIRSRGRIVTDPDPYSTAMTRIADAIRIGLKADHAMSEGERDNLVAIATAMHEADPYVDLNAILRTKHTP